MAKNSIFTGGGRLYYAPQNSDGSYGNLQPFGKTDGITLSTSVSFKEHHDTEGCTPLLDARFPSEVLTEVKFTTSEITLEMQNKAFLGDIIETEQLVGADVPIIVPNAEVEPGKIVVLDVYNISVLIVKDSTDVTTFTEGTDYEFDSKAGYLTIVEGGGIDGVTDLNLTATYPAQTVRTSATMKNSSLMGRFEVVTSSQTGNNFRYIFKRLSLTQDSDFNIKSSDEIGTLSFTGSAMIDTTTVSGELSDYLDIVELNSNAC